MGTTCYKSNKMSKNKVIQDHLPQKKNSTSPTAHIDEDDLKEKEIAKLTTNIPPPNTRPSIIENVQVNAYKSNIEDENSKNILKLPPSLGERSKTGSIKKFHPKKIDVKETSVINYSTCLDGGKMINNYKILESLGEGSYGKVKLCVKKLLDLEKKYAMKIFKKSKLLKIRTMKKNANGALIIHDALQDVMKEIAVMKKLDHPNVIRLHEVLYGEEKGKLYLVLDYASNGQLIEWNEDEGIFYYVKDPESHEYLPESTLRKIFRDCLLGLYYLHYNHIIHRDIKPQNILFDEEDTAKLADFGLSELYDGNETIDSTEGTYYFMAPELFINKKGIEGKPLDIWALGISFYCFIYMKAPFMGGALNEMIKLITETEVNFLSDRPISSDLKGILMKMLEKDPKKRITIEQLVSESWFNKDCEPLENMLKYITKVNLSEHDYENVVIPLERVVFIKQVIKKLRMSVMQNRSSSLPKNPSNEELDNLHMNNLNILADLNPQGVKSEMTITGKPRGFSLLVPGLEVRRNSMFKKIVENETIKE